MQAELSRFVSSSHSGFVLLDIEQVERWVVPASLRLSMGFMLRILGTRVFVSGSSCIERYEVVDTDNYPPRWLRS